MKLMFPETEHGRVNNLKGTWFNYNGWPSVTMDDRGVLYCVASSMRLSHVDPCGKNCMYVSYDQGKTWPPPVIVNDSYFDDRDGVSYIAVTVSSSSAGLVTAQRLSPRALVMR